MKEEYKDVIIIGAGVSGLRASISLENAGEVVVIAKDDLSESSSEYAQGGIAVALSDEDTVGIHFQDTINAGDGLCDEEAVSILVVEGPIRIKELIEWGTEFDKQGTKLAFTKEAAHSRNRILHAHGDSTGKEIVRALLARASHIPNIQFLEKHFTLKILISEDNKAKGIICIDEKAKEIKIMYAKAILLATGGSGRVYKETTNPSLATGDGLSYAFEAGAKMMDLEFVQFHPTSLYLKHSPRFLLSEALRGEGAYLINSKGERFMHKYHQLKELAPRDVVSRSIIEEMEITKSSCVFLDLRHLSSDFIKQRFPNIYNTCLNYGVDITKDIVPVHPAAHYFMGGVMTDLNARTSIEGLYAAGETACTGVHGANRLASNSLLEGIVFGARAGECIKNDLPSLKLSKSNEIPKIVFTQVDENYLMNYQKKFKHLAWDKIGIKRNEKFLIEALRIIKEMEKELPEDLIPNRLLAETINLKNVAKMIALFALLRTESRGAHYRIDFPHRDDKNWKKHQIFNKEEIEELITDILGF